jgi:hypothetical protein
MPRFDRNQTSLIDKNIKENTSNPKIGIVDQVFEHSAADDDSNWEINVLVDGKTAKLKRVPVHTPGSDVINPPKNGDKILVMFIEGQGNRPVALGTGWSSTDRPPLGQAGMFRNRFEASDDPSPAGTGDLHITGYTKYDKDVASNDKRELTAEETLVQIAKHDEGDNVTPTDLDSLPAKVEMYDSAKNDESWISVEINKKDGNDSDATWGMKFNIKTGEWKLVGPKGFGITSDGEGNFVWEHKDITFDEVSGSTGSLSL